MKTSSRQWSHQASRLYWNEWGRRFACSFFGAPTTQLYLEQEQHLFRRYFGDLKRKTLLKLDLWNEAQNTEILLWAAQEGAECCGIDIAETTALKARARSQALAVPLRIAVADACALPFPNDTFDCLYTMGTVEHFPDYDIAVRELFRVLKPHGRAIIGVPNKLDPFLRPLLVWLLNSVGLYAYGREKSFTRRALRRLLESAGFRVTAQTGLLFMPGWLRMLDLLCHTRLPRLAPVTGWLVRPFAWLYRRVPMVRRHGYLIAAVVDKPPGAGPG